MHIQLSTLGTLTVHAAGEELPAVAAHRSRMALLVYLAVEAEATRDRVLALLWPEQEAEKARHSLSQSLYLLRQTLGAEWLRVAGDRLLTTSALSCDARAFADAIDAADWRAALKNYHGPFLDGFHLVDSHDFEAWVDQQRARLERMHRRARRERINECVATGDCAAALDCARQWVEQCPLEDEAHHRLIELLASAGERTEALQQFEHYKRLLAAEALTPLEETRALAERVRTETTVALSHGHSADDASHPTARSTTITASDPDAASGTTTSLPRPGPRKLRRMVGAAAVSVAVVAVAAFLLALRGRSTLPTAEGVNGTNPNIIAVLPFRVMSVDSTLRSLEHGMVDLMAIRMSDAAGPHAVEPRAVIAAWRGSRSAGDVAIPENAAIALAHRLGAGRVVLGSVVSTLDQLTLSATLLDVASRRSGRVASVAGPTDSLLVLIDRLTARLLSLAADEPAFRLDYLTTTSLPALHAYLAGQAEYRRGRYVTAAGRFHEALRSDSTFALAAIGIVAAATWVPLPAPDRERAQAVAWAHRDRLTPRDSVRLLVLTGTRYPDPTPPREQLAFLESAVALHPDDPELWYALGDQLFHSGMLLDVHNWEGLATAAFERAIALDPEYRSPLDHLFLLAVHTRDMEGATRLREYWQAQFPEDPALPGARWTLALLRGDSVALRAARVARFGEFDRLRLGALVRVVELTGRGFEDAELALSVLRERAVSAVERRAALARAAELALNQGRPSAAVLIEDTLATSLPQPRDRDAYLRAQIYHALYWDGDRAAAAAAAQELATDAGDAESTADGELQARHGMDNLCAVEQWRVAQGDTHSTNRAVAKLNAAASAHGRWPTTQRTLTCAALLEAQRAERMEGSVPRVLVDRLDSLVLQAAPDATTPMPDVLVAANIQLARMLEAHAEYDRARRATTRRRLLNDGPRFLTTVLRQEGRLAALDGDTAGARRAYRHYLALRAMPEPHLVAQRDSVRAELARLFTPS